MKHLSREELAEAVAFADRLADANGIPENEAVLTEVLSAVLGERSTKTAVDALVHIVAFANQRKWESGTKTGDFRARQSIANTLRLGDLQLP